MTLLAAEESSASRLRVAVLKAGASRPSCPQGACQRPHPVLPLCHAGCLPGDHGAGEGGHVGLDHRFLCPHHGLRGCGQQLLDRLHQQHLRPEQPLPHEELAGAELGWVSAAQRDRGLAFSVVGVVGFLSLLQLVFCHMGFILET